MEYCFIALFDFIVLFILPELSSGADNHRERLLTAGDPDGSLRRHHRNDEELDHSGGNDYSRRNSGKEGRTSLAEDISSIRIALNGASTTAKERTLKTLERLTARLALAESERDVALGKFKFIRNMGCPIRAILSKKYKLNVASV